jgi:translation initiation factor IF-3
VIESPPLLDGRNMVMLLGPTKNAGVTTDAKDEDRERSQEALQGDGERQADAPARDEEPQPGAQVAEAEAKLR